jgi:ribose transport system substrate-binding protein
MWVNQGQLTATFLYAMPGAEGVRQGLKLMAGEKIILPTMTIDKSKGRADPEG